MSSVIEIFFNKGALFEDRIIIFSDENTCFYNERKYAISDDIIFKILNILTTWKYDYGTSNKLDDEEFKITVYSNSSKTTYQGMGIYPENYMLFKKLLGDIRNA